MTTMFSLILASCGSWGSAACWQTPNTNSSSVRWAGGKTNLGTCRAHLHAFRALWVLLYLESVRSRKHRYQSISRWKMYDFLFRIVVFTLPPEVPKPMINGGAAGFPLSFPAPWIVFSLIVVMQSFIQQILFTIAFPWRKKESSISRRTS